MVNQIRWVSIHRAKKMKKLIVILCIISFGQNIFAGSLMPYQKGDWESILKKVAGEKVVIHFWGVTCAPCVKEMPLWGKFTHENKNAKIMYIQVDDVSKQMVEQMLQKANLSKGENFYLTTTFDEYLRYEIDPQWRGETPMTIWIDRDGRRTRKIGTTNFLELKRWFQKNNL